MTSKPKSHVKIVVGDGNEVTFVGEVDNTTETIMGMMDLLQGKGLNLPEYEKGGKQEGMSLLATTLCG